MTHDTPEGPRQQSVRLQSFAYEAHLAGLYDPAFPASYERGEMLCQQGHESKYVILLESGLCTAVKQLRGGQQQNVAIYVPGDILGHEALTFGSNTSTVVTLARTTCYRIHLKHLKASLDEHKRVAEAFWRYVAFQGALGQEWMVSLGRRPAYERLAHFFCEMICRTKSVAQGSGSTCVLPLVQADLSAILGMSVVHVNRMLQRLRREGIIFFGGGRLEVLDWEKLTSIADFETSYLNLATKCGN